MQVSICNAKDAVKVEITKLIYLRAVSSIYAPKSPSILAFASRITAIKSIILAAMCGAAAVLAQDHIRLHSLAQRVSTLPEMRPLLR